MFSEGLNPDFQPWTVVKPHVLADKEILRLTRKSFPVQYFSNLPCAGFLYTWRIVARNGSCLRQSSPRWIPLNGNLCRSPIVNGIVWFDLREWGGDRRGRESLATTGGIPMRSMVYRHDDAYWGRVCHNLRSVCQFDCRDVHTYLDEMRSKTWYIHFSDEHMLFF